jgi:predicted nucleotidyltransferase
MLSENDIARIAERIARNLNPFAVGIFGSYAIGTAHERSDLDLFVIKEGREPHGMRQHAVRRQLFHVLQRVDIQVFSPTEFEEAARERMSFAWIIVRQARIYYWTEEAQRRMPLLAAKAVPQLSAAGAGARAGGEMPSRCDMGGHEIVQGRDRAHG